MLAEFTIILDFQFLKSYYNTQNSWDTCIVFILFCSCSINGLNLSIKSDTPVRSWNLTILDCTEKPYCYQEKSITDIGNHSVLLVERSFKPDVCYGFKVSKTFDKRKWEWMKRVFCLYIIPTNIPWVLYNSTI